MLVLCALGASCTRTGSLTDPSYTFSLSVNTLQLEHPVGTTTGTSEIVTNIDYNASPNRAEQAGVSCVSVTRSGSTLTFTATCSYANSRAPTIRIYSYLNSTHFDEFKCTIDVFTRGCNGATVNAQNLWGGSTFVQQLQCATQSIPVTFGTFQMHTDTISQYYNDPLFCGQKTYSKSHDWLSIDVPSVWSGDYTLRLNTNDPANWGVHDTWVKAELPNFSPTRQENFRVDLRSPCLLTTLSHGDQTIADFVYDFGKQNVFITFTAFTDTEAQCYSRPTLCRIQYSVASNSQGVHIPDANVPRIGIFTGDPARKGTSQLITLRGNAHPDHPQASAAPSLTFTVSIFDTCPGTVISLNVVDMTIESYIATEYQEIRATNTVSVSAKNIAACGPYDYQMTTAGDYSSFTTWAANTAYADFNLADNSFPFANVGGPYQVTIIVSLTQYPEVASVTKSFNLYIKNPCTLTTITLPTTLKTFDIMNFDAGFTQTFAPATNDRAQTGGKKNLCGPYVYSVSGTPDPTNFMSIIEPAAGSDPYTANWTLKALSTSFGDAGTYNIILNVYLQDYPTKTASKTVVGNVQHPCQDNSINALTLTGNPGSVQLAKGTTNVLLVSFVTATDVVSDNKSLPDYCGEKIYTTDRTWVTVVKPASWLTGTYELRLNSDSAANAGVKTVTIYIKFLDTKYTATREQTFDIDLLHPCKQTVITTSQTVLPDISFNFAGPAVFASFVDFSDSVAAAYAIPRMCDFAYYFTSGTDAETYGVTWESGTPHRIRVEKNVKAVKGTEKILYMKAISNPGQAVESSPQVQFKVIIVDTCPTASVSFTPAPTAMEYTVTRPQISQKLVAADSISLASGIEFVCEQYSVYQDPSTTYSWLTFDVPTAEIRILSSSKADIGGPFSVKIWVKLADPLYASSAAGYSILQVKLLDPCLSTSLTFPSMIASYQITAFLTTATKTFKPVTDSASQNANVPVADLCGPRIYTLVQTAFSSFLTITPPSDGLVYASDWSVVSDSQAFSDIGVHDVTIQCKLQNYVDKTQTLDFQVTVRDPCDDAVFNDVTLPATKTYQIFYIADPVANPQTIFYFDMHTDSTDIHFNNPVFCGAKKYDTGHSWLTIGTPANPASEQFAFQVATRDPSLAGTYTISLVASFVKTQYTQTHTQTFELIMVHPCVPTLLTTSQTISKITFNFADPAPVVRTFTDFSDTISTAYNPDGPNMCQVSYTLEPAADATSHGVSLPGAFGSRTISVYINEKAIKGSTVTLTLSAVTNPAQTTPSDTVTFQVEIFDTCPTTVITFSAALQPMPYTITKQPLTQPFIAATDSISDASGIFEVCNAYSYTLHYVHEQVSGNYQSTARTLDPSGYIKVDSATKMISISTMDMTLIGMNYLGLIRMTLDDYPTATVADVTFTFDLINPCLTTVLFLETTMPTVEITAWLPGGSFEWKPATDAATMTAVVPRADLCGQRTYSLQGSFPGLPFMNLTEPDDGLVLTSNWKLNYESNSWDDINTYSFTLMAVLNDYPSIQAAEQTFQVIVLTPCMGAEIQSIVLTDMRVSIWDDFKQVQEFEPALDTIGIRFNNTDQCGDKSYTSNNALIVVTPPSSGLLQVDIWTITSITQLKSDVGFYDIEITVTLDDYSMATSYVGKFVLEVYDNCATGTLDPQGQVIEPITFIVLVDENALQSSFVAFTDDVAQKYDNPTICGDKAYSIAEDRPWLQIIAPPPGNDTYVLSVYLDDIEQVGEYTTTVKGTFVDYPTATPGLVPFLITLVHACKVTELINTAILDMTYYMGQGINVYDQVQEFSFFRDKIAEKVKVRDFCGPRTYVIDEYEFLSFWIPSDPFVQPFEIIVTNEDLANEGVYSANLTATLDLYPEIPAATSSFKISLVSVSNKPPYFRPPLEKSVQVVLTNDYRSFAYGIPNYYDDDGDGVILSADLGYAANFVKLSAGRLEIDDLGPNGKAKPGMFFIKFKLSDGKDVVEQMFSLFVLPRPPVEKKDEDSSGSGGAGGNASDKEKLTDTWDPTQANKGNEDDSEKKLAAQNEENKTPDQVRSYMDKLTSAPELTPEEKAKRASFAWKNCVPASYKTYIESKMLVVLLEFYHVVSFESSAKLLKEIKASKSIQFQLLQADPLVQDKPQIIDWTMIRVPDNEYRLEIRLNFTYPESISSTSVGRDQMRILFKDPSQLISCPKMAEGLRRLKVMPLDTEFFIELPPMYVTGLEKSMAAIVDNPTSSTGALVSSVIVNYVTGLSANLLWGGINSLQLVASQALYKVDVPPNSLPLMQFVQTLVTFDMFYDIYDPNDHLPFSETPEFNSNFCLLRYCSFGFYDALGSVAVILVIQGIVWLGIPLIRTCALRSKGKQCSCCCKCFKKCFKKRCKSIRKRKGMWSQSVDSVSNAAIRLTLENYVSFVIAAGLSMYYAPYILASGQELNNYDKVNCWSGNITIAFTALFTFLICYVVIVEFPKVYEAEACFRDAEQRQPLIVFYDQEMRRRESILINLQKWEKRREEERRMKEEEEKEEESSQESEPPEGYESYDQEEEMQPKLKYWRDYTLDQAKQKPLVIPDEPPLILTSEEFEGGNKEEKTSTKTPRSPERRHYSVGNLSPRSPQSSPRSYRRRQTKLEFESFADDGSDQQNPDIVNDIINDSRPVFFRKDAKESSKKQLDEMEDEVLGMWTKMQTEVKSTLPATAVQTRGVTSLGLRSLEDEVFNMWQDINTTQRNADVDVNLKPKTAKTAEDKLEWMEAEVNDMWQKMQETQKSGKNQAIDGIKQEVSGLWNETKDLEKQAELRRAEINISSLDAELVRSSNKSSSKDISRTFARAFSVEPNRPLNSRSISPILKRNEAPLKTPTRRKTDFTPNRGSELERIDEMEENVNQMWIDMFDKDDLEIGGRSISHEPSKPSTKAQGRLIKFVDAKKKLNEPSERNYNKPWLDFKTSPKSSPFSPASARSVQTEVLKSLGEMEQDLYKLQAEVSDLEAGSDKIILNFEAMGNDSEQNTGKNKPKTSKSNPTRNYDKPWKSKPMQSPSFVFLPLGSDIQEGNMEQDCAEQPMQKVEISKPETKNPVRKYDRPWAAKPKPSVKASDSQVPVLGQEITNLEAEVMNSWAELKVDDGNSKEDDDADLSQMEEQMHQMYDEIQALDPKQKSQLDAEPQQMELEADFIATIEQELKGDQILKDGDRDEGQPADGPTVAGDVDVQKANKKKPMERKYDRPWVVPKQKKELTEEQQELKQLKKSKLSKLIFEKVPIDNPTRAYNRPWAEKPSQLEPPTPAFKDDNSPAVTPAFREDHSRLVVVLDEEKAPSKYDLSSMCELERELHKMEEKLNLPKSISETGQPLKDLAKELGMDGYLLQEILQERPGTGNNQRVEVDLSFVKNDDTFLASEQSVKVEPQFVFGPHHENLNENDHFAHPPPKYGIPSTLPEELSQAEKDRLLVQVFEDEYEDPGLIDLSSLKYVIRREEVTYQKLKERRDQLIAQRLHNLKRYQFLELTKQKAWLDLKYFESLREDMHPHYSSGWFHINFMVRRFVIIWIAFGLQNYPGVQLLSYMLTGIATMLYIAAARPFEDPRSDKLELFNEFLIVCIVDVYASMQGRYYNIKTSMNFGHLLNFLIMSLLMGNIGVMMYVSVDEIKNSIRKFQLWLRNGCPLRKKKKDKKKKQKKGTEIEDGEQLPEGDKPHEGAFVREDKQVGELPEIEFDISRKPLLLDQSLQPKSLEVHDSDRGLLEDQNDAVSKNGDDKGESDALNSNLIHLQSMLRVSTAKAHSRYGSRVKLTRNMKDNGAADATEGAAGDAVAAEGKAIEEDHPAFIIDTESVKTEEPARVETSESVREERVRQEVKRLEELKQAQQLAKHEAEEEALDRIKKKMMDLEHLFEHEVTGAEENEKKTQKKKPEPLRMTNKQK